MPVNATTPIKPDEELYDSIDQLAEWVCLFRLLNCVFNHALV